MSQEYARWAVAQQARINEQISAEREQDRKNRELVGGWLSEMRWKITGPEEEYDPWIRYCGEHSIVITRQMQANGPRLSEQLYDWRKRKGLEAIQVNQTDEILLVPKDFMLKCLALGCLPPP